MSYYKRKIQEIVEKYREGAISLEEYYGELSSLLNTKHSELDGIQDYKTQHKRITTVVLFTTYQDDMQITHKVFV